MSDVVLVSYSTAGHRQAYIDQFSGMVAGWGGEARVVDNWRAATSAPDPVLFLMIEESLLGYSLASLIRCIRGRRTVGLLFRGGEAARGGDFRLLAKRMVLSGLRRLPHVTTLSIIPFHAEPRLATLADNWIDDPQLWDLEDFATPATSLSESIVALAAGRRIVVSLGAQNASKGLPFFAATWCEQPKLRERQLFVAAGKVSPDSVDAAAALSSAGGVVVNRFLTDVELASLYGVADVVWAVYRPEYDQASGIFGRAVQYGRPVILRRGSAVAAHASLLQVRAFTIDYGDTVQAADVIGQTTGPVPIVLPLDVDLRKRNSEIVRVALLGSA